MKLKEHISLSEKSFVMYTCGVRDEVKAIRRKPWRQRDLGFHHKSSVSRVVMLCFSDLYFEQGQRDFRVSSQELSFQGLELWMRVTMHCISDLHLNKNVSVKWAEEILGFHHKSSVFPGTRAMDGWVCGDALFLLTCI